MRLRHMIDVIAEQFPDFMAFTPYSQEELQEREITVYEECARWLNEDLLFDEEHCERNAAFVPKIAALLNGVWESRWPNFCIEDWLSTGFFYSVDAQPLKALIPFLSADMLNMAKSYYERTGFCPVRTDRLEEFFADAYAARPAESEGGLGVLIKIYVGKLPLSADEEQVRNLFAQHGTVQSVSLPGDHTGGCGFGFVTMPRADAMRAIKNLNGFSMDGCALRVRSDEWVIY